MKISIINKKTLITLSITAALALGACTSCTSEESDPTAETSFDRERAPWEQVSEMQNDWCNEVVQDAVRKLADDGAVERPIEGMQIREIFEFREDGDGYVIDFKDKAKEKELTDEFTAEMDDVIISSALPTVFYKRYGGDAAEDDAQLPWFYPLYCDNSEVYHFAGREDVFADSMEECRYLIIEGALNSMVEEDFYWGGMDRVTRTTVVLIFDVRARELVHVEYLGTDTPPASNAQSTFGKYFQDEADTYIMGLLG